jgi:hypothetical protein
MLLIGELEATSDTVIGTIHERKKIILSVSRLIYHQMAIIASNMIVFFIDNDKQLATTFNFIDVFL